MESARDLAKKGQLPVQWAKGGQEDIDTSVVMEGYLAAMAALPRYTPDKGDLGAFFYATAKGHMRNTAWEESNVFGMRECKAEMVIHNDERGDQGGDEAGPLSSDEAEMPDQSQADADAAISRAAARGVASIDLQAPHDAFVLEDPTTEALDERSAYDRYSKLSAEDRELLESRGEKTIQNLADERGVSRATMHRRLEKLKAAVVHI
jgi:hypothetical protein